MKTHKIQGRKLQAKKRLSWGASLKKAKDTRDAQDAVVITPVPWRDTAESQPTLPKDELKDAAAAKKADAVPAAPPYTPIDGKGRKIIYVGLERGNRVLVRWPDSLAMFTEQMDTGTSAIGRLLGKIEELKDGSNKKLIPLNYYNAKKVLFIIRQYVKIRAPDGKRMYKAILSDEFAAWFDEEDAAKELCDNAHHLLDYDENIQTEFDFLRKPLYPWQSAGMSFLDAITRHGKGAFVCDETGTGKTYTVTAHLASQKLQAVVVAPAGVCESWRRKIIDISNLTCTVIGSAYPQDAYKYDVIIVSYAMLKKRGLWPLSDIISGQQRVLIMDEGHYAKNYTSKRTSTCLLLAENAKHSIVVTATPLKNRVKELHPLLRMTRRLWTEESRDDFTKWYDTEEGRQEIAERLTGFMVRRMFKEIKPDFPTGEVGEAWLTLDNREVYKEAEANFIQWLINNGAGEEKLASAERGKALVKLNRLRQLAAMGKVRDATRLIGKTLDAGEQCIVFCAFNDPLLKIASAFADTKGTNFKGQEWNGSGVITGKVSKKKRYDLIDKFMAGKLGLLCIGVGAGGLGIDLPIARFAYFLDLPWGPADFEQCTGRILRLGQERDCQFVKLLASNTIDQRMETIIQLKAIIFQEAIGDPNAVDRVTAKEAKNMRSSIVSMLISAYIKEAIEQEIG
jgi:SWI/SNF-related matrix-associated actin-dependent regulator of chromatin subfamily A-like protein 1